MTPFEIYEVLKKTLDVWDLDTMHSDNWSLYKFDDYMNENYPDFDYSIDSGASKLVIIPDEEDWVIKIPFAGTENWDNQDSWEDEETGEWVYDEEYDPWYAFSEDLCEYRDYCEKENDIFEMACEEALDFAFAGTKLIGYVGNAGIYMQEKATSFGCKGNYTKEEKQSFSDNYRESWGCSKLGRLNIAWCIDFVKCFGQKLFDKLLDFIDENHINDLHNQNVGYIGEVPVLVDFSGYISY